MVVHGSGIDEISTVGPTRVSELAAGAVRTYDLRPEDFGLAAGATLPPPVADAAASAAVIRGVLAGEAGRGARPRPRQRRGDPRRSQDAPPIGARA